VASWVDDSQTGDAGRQEAVQEHEGGADALGPEPPDGPGGEVVDAVQARADAACVQSGRRPAVAELRQSDERRGIEKVSPSRVEGAGLPGDHLGRFRARLGL
jgi:hypothetical protein